MKTNDVINDKVLNLKTVIADKPFLKITIEKIIQECLNNKDMSLFEVSINKIFGESLFFLSLLVDVHRTEQSYNALENMLNEESADLAPWLYDLALCYGKQMQNLFFESRNQLDWEEISDRLIMDSNLIVQLTITRADKEKFTLETSKDSYLYMLKNLTGKLPDIAHFETFEQDERDILQNIMDQIQTILGEA